MRHATAFPLAAALFTLFTILRNQSKPRLAMKKSTLGIILSIAIPALGTSQTIENPETDPAQVEETPAEGPRRVPPDTAPPAIVPQATAPERAKDSPAPAADRASEAMERARAKNSGKGKGDRGNQQPSDARGPAKPESNPSSAGERSEDAGRGKGRTPPPADPATTAPTPARDMRDGKGARSDRDERPPAPPAPETTPPPADPATTAPTPARDMRDGKGARSDRDERPPAPPAPGTAPPRPESRETPPRREIPRTMPPRTVENVPAVEADVAPERPSARRSPSQETSRALEDRGRRDRRADAAEAMKIKSPDEAQRLISTILGSAAAGAISSAIATRLDDRSEQRRKAYRPPVEEVGRTQRDRERNVVSIASRFSGSASETVQTHRQSSREVYRDRSGREYSESLRTPHYYNDNRRVVRYSSRNEIPPVLIAYHRLNRVEVLPVAGSPYAHGYQGSQQVSYETEIPQSYLGGDAHAVSYQVDPDTVISRDDILYRQGSTEFADAYSFDLVIDIAEAMNTPSLIEESFVIEGHASTEGDYGKNLLLSQERAERIARDLVNYGVNPDRLLPVGYGISEALYPANAPEHLRRLDRRVMVFRMQ